MGAEIAVRGPEHVENITCASAERLSHADVVFEDLAGRRGHVSCAVEEAFDDGVSQR